MCWQECLHLLLKIKKMTSTQTACFRLLFGLFVFLLFPACSSTEEPGDENDSEVVETEKASNPFSDFIGKWADISGENEFYELWETNDAGLEGTGLVLSEGDTVFIEHLEVFLRNGKWYYSARIDGQNRGDAIEFRNTIAEDSLFVFENPDHDFPQSISYQFMRNGDLQIMTRGVEDGVVRTEEFNMKPVESTGQTAS